MSTNFSGEVAIAGVYEHPDRKLPGMHPFEVQARCILNALDDAGLTINDVDGFATAAGEESEGGGVTDAVEMAEYLGIRPTWIDSTDLGGAGPISQVGHAAAAIATGQADVVVVGYGATPRSSASNIGTGDTNTPTSGPGQFELPYGITTVGNYALAAQRHMHEFGTTSEQLAEIAVACRTHAANNPHARHRDPLTVEDVVNAPMIASPFRRYDCCIVTDGGGAVVVTSAERARDLPKKPAYVLGFGEAASQIQMHQMPSFTETAGTLSGPRAFAQAGVRHDQIDVAQIYDSFTITSLLILEDLGFCAKGEGGSFVSDGRIALGGDLPINTDGGGLSSNQPGRRGIFTMIENVRQIRGESPGAQVPVVDFALCHGSGGYLSTAATLILGS